MEVESVKQALMRQGQPVPPSKYLGTGSTLVNLACSGRLDGGFPVGRYVFYVGDTTSGKTWIGMSCFAEAVLRPDLWSDYRFIYDGIEFGAQMDVEKFFGKEVAKRMEPPAGTRVRIKCDIPVSWPVYFPGFSRVSV